MTQSHRKKKPLQNSIASSLPVLLCWPLYTSVIKKKMAQDLALQLNTPFMLCYILWHLNPLYTVVSAMICGFNWTMLATLQYCCFQTEACKDMQGALLLLSWWTEYF